MSRYRSTISTPRNNLAGDTAVVTRTGNPTIAVIDFQKYPVGCDLLPPLRRWGLIHVSTAAVLVEAWSDRAQSWPSAEYAAAEAEGPGWDYCDVPFPVINEMPW